MNTGRQLVASATVSFPKRDIGLSLHEEEENSLVASLFL